MTAAAALAIAMCGVLLSSIPASATTTGIYGTQWDSTTVYWSRGRVNSYANNGMSISPYSYVNCGMETLQVGARYTAGIGASNGKTGVMSEGQSSAFFNSNLGNYQMPMGTFYLTTSTGPSGPCNTPETWYATLIYNVSN